MKNNIIKIFKPTYFFLIILIFGFFLRFYNLNFDDFWIDELSTFWIANPEISLKDSYLNHKTLEQTPFLFNLTIRVFFWIFGYKVEISRYLPFLFSFMSIISIAYISKLLSNNNSYIFSSFLISFNIFLISYSQELRVYSALLFFISLSLIFFLRTTSNNQRYDLFFFNFFTIISILLHPFALILLITYLTLFVFFKKKFFTGINISLILLTILSLVFYYHFIKSSLTTPSWILQPDLKFFTNFYFSKFFGSRLIGLIHLFIFIFLISKFFNKIISDYKITIFFILFIYAYFLPLAYGYFFKPIILARYIIFVLIPITVLFSYFIFELKNLKKNIFIWLIVLVTIGNLFTEQTIKQFYKQRSVYKPEFTKSLSIIKNSNHKYFSFKIEVVTKEIDNDTWGNALKNYLEFLISKNKLDISYLNFDNTDNKKIWIFCVHDLNNNNCNLSSNLKVHKVHKLNRLDLILANFN